MCICISLIESCQPKSTSTKFDLQFATSAATHSVQFRLRTTSNNMADTEIFKAGVVTIELVNPLNAELNPICHLLALLGGATIVVVSRLRVNVHYVW